MPCNYSCDNINAICKVNEIFLIRKIFQQFFISLGSILFNTVRMVTFTGGGTNGHTFCHFCPYAPCFAVYKAVYKSYFHHIITRCKLKCRIWFLDCFGLLKYICCKY